VTTRWQYAQLRIRFGTLSAKLAADYVTFSHVQAPGLVQYAKSRLGQGLKEKESTDRVLSMNMSHITPLEVLAFLGDLGFEGYSYSQELPPTVGNPSATLVWMFKRPAD
jgi:hypothetical protein